MAKLGNLKGATGATGASLNGSGTFASRPSAGTTGRTYFASDIGVTYIDTGVSWLVISCAQLTIAGLVGVANGNLSMTLAQITIPTTGFYPQGTIIFGASGLLAYPASCTLTLSVVQNTTVRASCTWTAGSSLQSNKAFHFWGAVGFPAANNSVMAACGGTILLAAVNTLSSIATVNNGVAGAASDVWKLNFGTSSNTNYGVTPLEAWAQMVSPIV